MRSRATGPADRRPRPRLVHAGLTRAGLALGAFLSALAGCLSPTLPLPPPEEPGTITENTDGTWQVAGSCIEGAQVVLLNEARGRGVVLVDQDATGHYSIAVAGDACDVIVLTQSLGDEASGETRFALRAVESGAAVDPAACH